MELLAFVRKYALENDIRTDSIEQLLTVARLITRFNGGALPLEELTNDLANRWLVYRQELGLSADTVSANRTKLLTLWRAAADAGLCQGFGKIRRIKKPRRIPRAFTHDELSALLAAANRLRGNIRHRDTVNKCWIDTGVKRRTYMAAWIHAAYDCALRRSDMQAIERQFIMPYDGGGMLGIVQSKTGRTIVVRFRPTTMKAIDELLHGRKTGAIWIAYGTRRIWCQAFKRLCKRAGVDGSAKYLRRSSASYFARDHGRDAAKRHLGHASDTVIDESYIDPTIAYPAPLLPPAFTK